jgi:zinc and cadmium transporter
MFFTTPIAVAVVFFSILIVGTVPMFWEWKNRYLDTFISFGAGVLLSAAFVHMLPSTAIGLQERAGIFLLAGFIIIFVVEHYFLPHHSAAEHSHHIGYPALIGLSLHSLIEATALGVTVQQSTDHSLVASMMLGVGVHKIPEVLALTAILLSSHWTKGKVFVAIFCFAAINSLGILFSSLSMPADLLNAAVGVSGGTFIYVAAIDLIPHINRRKESRWMNLVAFILGAFLLTLDIFGSK